MKKLFFLSVMLLAFGIFACGQKNVPQPVNKAFSQKFPSAASVKWDNEEANEWEADFKLNGKEMSASFDNSGKWLETETEIAVKDLPASVSGSIAKEFPGFKIDEISILENSTLKGFEVGLKNGETALEVVLDNAGKVLKKNDVSKEEKDEKAEKGEKPERK
ncbi:MAG: PepSY-like domain-containing protein [Bacteroidales bacterium]